MTDVTATGTAPGIAPEELETYRRELTGYCYRMLGSAFDAADAVQESYLHALRAGHSFEGRSSLRSWLYRIATNVCMDMHRSAQRRARPMDLGPASVPDEANLGARLPEATWVTPIADDQVLPDSADPAEVAVARESIRLAFVTALQHLPARQRAVLILCEVLRWQAAEVAQLLGTSVPAVNSALQRARATMAALPAGAHPRELDPDNAELLGRYVDAFERYDIPAFVSLLHDDAVMSMPPFPMWLDNAADIGRFMVLPGPSECRGSKLIPTAASGCPAFGQYKPDPAGGYVPWGLQVLEIADGRISGWHCFLDTARLFPAFGLPTRLPA